MPTEKATNFQYIRITNKNRTTGTPSNFTYSLTNNTFLHGVSAVWIQAVTFPNVFYNVNTHNNKLKLDYNAIQMELTVTPGFYSAASILSELETQINAAITPETVTITIDSITGLINFLFFSSGAQIYSTDTEPTLSTLAPVLGIYTTTASGLMSYTADGIPSLQGEQMVYLHSKQINLGNTSIATDANNNRQVSTFCSIPVTVPFLNVVHYESFGADTDLIEMDGNRDIASLSIKLRSVDGRILELGDNHELTIVLKCFY